MKLKKCKVGTIVKICKWNKIKDYNTWLSSCNLARIKANPNDIYEIVVNDKTENLNVKLQSLSDESFYVWVNNEDCVLKCKPKKLFYFISIFGKIKGVDLENKKYEVSDKEIETLKQIGNYFTSKKQAKDSDLYKYYNL